jgi:hypothetical protein
LTEGGIDREDKAWGVDGKRRANQLVEVEVGALDRRLKACCMRIALD